MASARTPSVSPFLKEAADLKITELYHARDDFKNRYAANQNIVQAGDHALKRVTVLLKEMKRLDPYLEDEDDFRAISRYLEQARNDNSITDAKLGRFEKQLLEKLNMHGNRLDVAVFQVELLKEFLNKKESAADLAPTLEQMELEDGFELVEGGLENVFETFEKNAFASKPDNTESIEKYLDEALDCVDTQVALDRLRDDMKFYATDVMDGSIELADDELEWCIRDLLSNGLLSNDKQKTLEGYLQSPAALREIKSTLNMKTIRHWNWRKENGLPVVARQNEDGKYCITVDEDLTDTLFHHTLAIGFSAKLRTYLEDLVEYPHVWPNKAAGGPGHTDRRDYYLHPFPTVRPAPVRQQHMPRPSVCHGPPPFPPPMPPPMPYIIPGTSAPPPPPPPDPFPIIYPSAPRRKAVKRGRRGGPVYRWTVAGERLQLYVRDFFLSRLPSDFVCAYKSKDVKETQADLIKVLAVESKLRERFDGEVHGFTANFTSFASSLPHDTILTTLKYIGMPEQWLEVFKRFLRAPLNMGPIVRGSSDKVVTRTCGVPIAHGWELFFSELILFFLDYTVRKKTGTFLYRLRDKCYFVGKKEHCDTVAEIFKTFSNAFGLNYECGNMENTTIGHFVFKLANGKASFGIDDEKTDAYARRIKKQLTTCTTVIDWVRTWNSTVGEYSKHLFGPLANILGPKHVDLVMESYNRIHEIIFEHSDLTSYVTQLLQKHLPRSSNGPLPIEPLVHLPFAFGGLGVKNPYTTLNIARPALSDPKEEIDTLLEDEKKHYESFKKAFDATRPQQLADRIKEMFSDDKNRLALAFGIESMPDYPDTTAVVPAITDKSIIPECMRDFMTMEEFTKNRESLSYLPLNFPPYGSQIPSPPLLRVLPNPHATYQTLLDEPVNHVYTSDRVIESVNDSAGKGDVKRWRHVTAEDRWVLQMYAEECFERYGRILAWAVDAVPLEALKAARGIPSDALRSGGDIDNDSCSSDDI